MEWPKTFNELTGIKNPTIITHIIQMPIWCTTRLGPCQSSIKLLRPLLPLIPHPPTPVFVTPVRLHMHSTFTGHYMDAPLQLKRSFSHHRHHHNSPFSPNRHVYHQHVALTMLTKTTKSRQKGLQLMTVSKSRLTWWPTKWKGVFSRITGPRLGLFVLISLKTCANRKPSDWGPL